MSIQILIADDHAVFRSGLQLLLEKETDFKVVGQTEDGIQTLQMLNKVKVDILLLDISMPGISGPRIAEESLKICPKLSILVLTMYEDEYYLQELFKSGVRGFALKRSSGTELVQAIRSVYKGNQYVDPAMASYLISPYIGAPSPPKTGRLDILSQREQEICGFLAYGHTNSEIAEKLFISQRTVETHRANIMAKLGLKSRAELVRFAIDHGLMKM